MIKHRFILRDVSDFRIFAAIPVEASLLTWKRWQRPPDWPVLKERCVLIAKMLDKARRAFDTFRTVAKRLYDVTTELRGEDKSVAELAERMESHAEWAETASSRVAASIEAMRSAVEFMPPDEDNQTADHELFIRCVTTVASDLASDVDPDRAVNALYERYSDHTHVLTHRAGVKKEKYRPIIAAMTGTFAAMVTQLSVIRDVIAARSDAADELLELIGSVPLPTTLCPPGLPFAAYTVEFDGTVISVVEGSAWVSARHGQSVEEAIVEKAKTEVMAAMKGVPDDRKLALIQQAEEKLRAAPDGQTRAIFASYEPTPDERRVVEIVSQMLTERSLNPKADTRIPVREVDPKHAHQTREAERRATAPAVRTIKFEVTPPRYLREAAEHILTSPRKAHWVIGHWRNQPYGEKHALRRQSWIKPHIRGLGEAGATTARVVAPHSVHP